MTTSYRLSSASQTLHTSDIIQLRGPKNEVKCIEYMQKIVADLVRRSPVCCSLLCAWITLGQSRALLAWVELKHLKRRELSTLFWLNGGRGVVPVI